MGKCGEERRWGGEVNSRGGGTRVMVGRVGGVRGVWGEIIAVFTHVDYRQNISMFEV
ncbi:MAG: hypothetical protein F6K22_38250 [Okeania sp. SIO2F4]|uniref:hypothetical protein n=1 Tax=Okeania sp. SIO2F4 TaxID=2607790 RepID=UPI00142B9F88|nr:hypothetical protein [Okeania sp. SIO2F4]NES08109.1 hypothetical protein [Okeania sp. SIO2F4]